MEREEFADFYAESFQRLVGQLYAMIGDRCEARDVDLAHDGIAAKVTVGSFCSSDPAPAGVSQVVSVPKVQPGQAAIVTINPKAIPAGTELSFGNFQLANSGKIFLALIDTGSYTCTSTAPNPPPHDTAVFGFSRSPSR